MRADANAALRFYGGKLNIRRPSLRYLGSEVHVQRVRLVYEGGGLKPDQAGLWDATSRKVAADVRGVEVLLQ